MDAKSGLQAVNVLADYTHLPQYLKVKWKGLVKRKRSYTQTRDYWRDVFRGRINEGQVVRLKNVVLTEWFPRVPGLAPKVVWGDNVLAGDVQRDRRARNAFEFKGEYYRLNPSRKTLVVLSGYGTMRFAPRKEGRLLSACSAWGPDVAEGIPILMRPQAYDKLSETLSRGILTTLEGVYSRVPGKLAASVWKGKGIPPYCIVVESQMLVGAIKEWAKPILCYAWTLFEYPTDEGRQYAFAFATCNGMNSATVDKAAEFIQGYVDNYHGSILTDFDEDVPRFDAQVSLGDLMNKRIDMDKLNKMISKIQRNVDKKKAETLLLAVRTGGLKRLLA